MVEEEQEDVEGIVDSLRSPPVVAVVPVADGLPVQIRKLRCEHRVQIRVGVTADRRVLRIQGDVGEIVQAREQTDLGELAHSGQECELDVRVRELDGRVQASQVIAVGPGDLRCVQCIQNRLVVLVHEHRDSLTGALVQRLQQVIEPLRPGDVLRCQARSALQRIQLRHQVPVQVSRCPIIAAAEIETQDRIANGPVPVAVNGKPLEQRLVALEQLLQRVEEQALAEAARTGEEVVLALFHQPPHVGRLVDVVAALLPDLAEGLDADGQLASGHRRTLPRPPAVSRAPPWSCRANGSRPRPGRLCDSPRRGVVRIPPGVFDAAHHCIQQIARHVDHACLRRFTVQQSYRVER